jgi:hypothetical protein
MTKASDRKALHRRMRDACPAIPIDCEIEALETGPKIKFKGVASDQQIAQIRRWLISEAELHAQKRPRIP